MSLGYAEKLSYIEDVGSVGMTEYYDTPHVLEEKAERLALMIKKSKHLVVFTGAGISTSCGIPDFRGPKGIWTLQKEGKTMPEASLPFHRAMPSMTHMALVELEQAGILKFIISQNIDGLHLRSGIPREKLSELHGNSFMEMCPSCGVEYIRDFEVETIGLKETTRSCTKAGCGARLRDTVLDWEDALPPKEINPAEKHCKMADLVLCLGTSLQITPACNLPLKCLRNGGEIVIVNLQKTPKDKDASLVIHGFVDKVIAGVMNFLRLQIPPFIRIDLFQTIFTQALSLDKKYVNWTLKLASIHGKKAPLPFIKSVEVSFSESPNMKAAILDKEPFCLKRRTVKTADPFDITFRLNLSEGCKCICAETKIPVHFMDSVKDSVYNFKDDDGLVFDKLRREAMADPNCGQTALFERETILVPKTDIFVHAIVTNIVKYEATQSSTNGLKRKHEGFNGTIPSRKRSKRHWKLKHPLIN